MINQPGMFWGVCNTPLPMRDKFLINTYLLNPIPGRDWIVRVWAYYIFPTNIHIHRQMIDPPDTFLDVCNTPIPIRNKYLINTYLLNFIPSKDWIACVGAYCIRPTNAHYHEKMIDPLDTFRGICNTLLHMPYKYLINKYLLNPIPGKDWMVCIGAYYIRPTNAHDYRQMIDPPDTFQSVCNTTLPIRDKNLIPLWTMNLKLGTF